MFGTHAPALRRIVKEWRRRRRSRSELARLGAMAHHDLNCRFNVAAELKKPFWQA